MGASRNDYEILITTYKDLGYWELFSRSNLSTPFPASESHFRSKKTPGCVMGRVEGENATWGISEPSRGMFVLSNHMEFYGKLLNGVLRKLFIPST